MLLCAAGCGVELEHNLEEREANQVLAVLDEAGITADKQAEDGPGGRYLVSVPRADVPRAVRLLAERDLPRRGPPGLSALSSSLLPSPTESRARYAAALSAELERTLQAVPGVQAARVHVALPSEDPLVPDEPGPRPTASLLVRARGPLGLDDAALKRLVAGAVQGLLPADVSVAITREEPLPQPRPTVARGRDRMTTVAASALVVILLLGLGLVVTALRLSSLKRRLLDRS